MLTLCIVCILILIFILVLILTVFLFLFVFLPYSYSPSDDHGLGRHGLCHTYMRAHDDCLPICSQVPAALLPVAASICSSVAVLGARFMSELTTSLVRLSARASMYLPGGYNRVAQGRRMHM